jgi:hypothetical protein
VNQVSTFRLYVLRATYLLLVVGLVPMVWGDILTHPASMGHMASVVRAMLGAVSVLALLGLRYPLRMIPLLMFELVWKTIWLAAFALPAWMEHRMTPSISQSVIDCGAGLVILPLALPWGYLWREYVKQPGDRWGGARREGAAGA